MNADHAALNQTRYWITIIGNTPMELRAMISSLKNMQASLEYAILSNIEVGEKPSMLQYKKLHCHLFLKYHKDTLFTHVYDQLHLERFAGTGYWIRTDEIKPYHEAGYVKYCLKSETKVGDTWPLFEHGTRIEKKKRSTDTSRIELAKKCKTRKECIAHDESDLAYWLSFAGREIMKLYRTPEVIVVPDKHIMSQQRWVIGEPGLGKTHTLIEYYTILCKEKLYLAPPGRFWDGYDPDFHTMILLEDVDTEYLKAFGDNDGISKLKAMTDGKPFWYEEKGMARELSPAKPFIVSSNIAMQHLLDPKTTTNIGIHITALERRFIVSTLRQFMTEKNIYFDAQTQHILKI